MTSEEPRELVAAAFQVARWARDSGTIDLTSIAGGNRGVTDAEDVTGRDRA